MSAPQPKFWTTRISAGQTASEIGEVLRKHGAKRYMVEWDKDGDPVAIQFGMLVPGLGVEVPVRLAAQTEAIAKRLNGDYARAWRVAWRQLKAWVEVSMELVANGVKPFHETFMSDVVIGDGGERVTDMFEREATRLLGSGDTE